MPRLPAIPKLPWPALRLLAIPLLAVGLLSGVEWGLSGTPEATARASQWNGAGYGPRSYAQAVALVGDRIRLGEERVRNGSGEWLRHESLARALMAQARLAYTYDDLAHAGAVLETAQSLAPANSGPLQSKAVFAMMAHRLSDAELALDQIDTWAVPPSAAERAEIAGLRGDIAFFRGDMKLARRQYDAATAIVGQNGSPYRQARLAKATGDFDNAAAYFAQASIRPADITPLAHANTALQIGAVELARGNYPEANEWFATADRIFPGYWLFEAHVAQGKALAGDLPGAIADMRHIARRAPSVEVIDALAMLLRANGDAAESRMWAQSSADLWAQRMKAAAEAAIGHALEHELVFGTPGRALELARRNLEWRPYGESRILLASALLMNGENAAALEQLNKAEQSGWRSAPLYALKSQALEFAGEHDAAQQAREAALELNPRIFDAATSYVWFSHG